MDMDKDLLKTFCKYQQTVLFEELEFQKFSDTIITDPQEKVVSYYIFEQHLEGNQPSQTDILYALRMPHSTLRKILKKLIKVGYVTPCEKHDARFTHYKPTEMVIEGFKIHTARHFKTLLKITKQLGSDKTVIKLIEISIEQLLGSYSAQKAYGDMDLDIIKDILQTLDDKQNNNSVPN